MRKTNQVFHSAISMVLAFCLVLGMCSNALTVLAEGSAHQHSDAFHYVSLGSGQTNGLGLAGYGNNAGYQSVPEGSYPDLIRDALQNQGKDVHLDQLAIRGMRVEELRMLLDQHYYGDAFTKANFYSSTGEGIFSNIAKGEGMTNADALAALRAAYQSAISNADLITIDIGINNFGEFILGSLENSQDPQYAVDFDALFDNAEDKKAFQEKFGQIEGIIGGFAGERGTDVKGLLETFAYAYMGFCVNFDKVVQSILALNPDVTIVVVSIDIPTNDQQICLPQGNGEIPVGEMYRALVQMADVYTSKESAYASKYYYAGAGESAQQMEDRLDQNGHRNRAEEILKAIEQKTSGDRFADGKLNFAQYHKTPQSYYVAIGDGILGGETYVDLLAKKLEVPYKNLCVDDTILGAAEIIAKNEKEIAKADLITIGYSNSSMSEKAMLVMADAVFGKEGYQKNYDWSKLMDAETLNRMNEELKNLHAKLVEEGLDQKYPGAINGLTFADAIVEAMKTYLYETISYFTLLPQLIDSVRKMNPNAVIVVIGSDNPFAGTTFSFKKIIGKEKEIHIEGYFGYMVAVAEVHGMMCALQEEGVIFVTTPEAETGGTNQVFEIGPAWLTDFLQKRLRFYPTAAGHAYIEEQVLNALYVGHNAGAAVVENRTESTCSEHGSYEEVVYCVDCGFELGRTKKTISLKEHIPAAPVVENLISNSCEAGGTYDEVVYCQICQNEMSRERKTIPAAGHVEKIDPAVAPTCTQTGLTEGKHCSVCNKILVPQQIVAELGHSEVLYEGQAATCTQKGWHAYVECTRCDYTTYKEIAQLQHVEGEAVVENRQGATCGEAGSYDSVIYCLLCHGEMSRKTITLPATGRHNYLTKVDTECVEPTCTTAGKTVYACSCGAREVIDIPARGHVEVADAAVDATCTTDGLTAGIHCAICGEILAEQKLIPAKGHKEVVDPEVKATCTTTGLTEGKHCSVCNKILIPQQIVTELGHSVVHHEGQAATCTQKGWHAYVVCSRCDYTTYKEIAPLGHKAGEEVIENKQGATCGAAGTYDSVVYCLRCHEEMSRKTITQPATGQHNYLTKVEAECVEATCTAAGKMVYACSCGARDVRDIPARGHVEVVLQAVDATCTTDGLTTGKCCANCPEILVKQQVIPAKGHTEVIDPEVKATCTATGLTEGKHCAVCNKILISQQIVASLGHNEVLHEGQAATCTQKGWNAYVACSRCGYTTYKEIAPLGHKAGEEVIENRQGATCGEAGSYDVVVYCTTCDEVMKKTHVTIDATGQHNYLTKVDAECVEPTCTTAGKTVYVCSCGAKLEKTILAKGHTEIIDPGVAATCTTAGLSAGKHCTVCDKVLLEQKVIPAKDHTVVIDPAVARTCTADGLTAGKHCAVCNVVIQAQIVLKAVGHMEIWDPEVVPTCTTTGLTAGKHCSVCNTVTVAQQVVSARGHRTTGAVKENIKNAACGEAGYYESVVYCADCKKELSRDRITIPATGGHNYVTKVEQECVAATCTTPGKMVYACSCGATQIETIAAKGHQEVASPAVAATCTTVGWTAGVRCASCGVVLVQQNEIPAKGHQYATFVKTPTCTEKGYTTYTCHCGESYVDHYVDALGHNWDAGTIVLEPTQDREGQRKHTCSRCSVTKVERIPQLGHVHSYTAAVIVPTCTQKGYTVQTCRCGDSYTEHYVDALGHSYGQWYESKAPSCTGAGQKCRDCVNCGHVEVQSLDALTHSFTHYVSDKNATTEADGTKTAQCDHGCGKTHTVVDEGSKLTQSDITSDIYDITDGYIGKIGHSTTVEGLLAGIHHNANIEVYKDGKTVGGDTILGTGMVIRRVVNGQVVAELVVVITGDTNGDGKITITDMLAIKAHLLKKSTLNGAAGQAADANADGSISITDFIQLKAHVLGKSEVKPAGV